MLKRSVIAADITNLTDARYFSSWGVDYLHFNLDHLGIDDVISIIEWVDGVDILLEFSVDSIGDLDKAMIIAKPFAVGASDKDIFEGLLGLGMECKLFFRFEKNGGQNSNIMVMSESEYIDPKTLQISPTDQASTFMVAPSDQEAMLNLLEQNQSFGFILQAEGELQTGMKNFDNMDAILEILEE